MSKICYTSAIHLFDLTFSVSEVVAKTDIQIWVTFSKLICIYIIMYSITMANIKGTSPTILYWIAHLATFLYRYFENYLSAPESAPTF